MNIQVSGETPFKAVKETLTIGPVEGAYTLYCAVEKNGTYTAISQECPANEVHVINGVTPYCWLKCVGATGEFTVIV